MRYGNKTLQFGHTVQELNHKYGTYKLWAEMVWAEMVMGRNGHGPKWLWAEMTSDRYNEASVLSPCWFALIAKLVVRLASDRQV